MSGAPEGDSALAVSGATAAVSRNERSGGNGGYAPATGNADGYDASTEPF